MPRYIDADKIYDAIFDNWCGIEVANIGDILQFIEDTPTADVAEVKHGEWRLWDEIMDKGKLLGAFCSLCNRHSDNDYNYCPHCGAKMGGRNND